MFVKMVEGWELIYGYKRVTINIKKILRKY